MRYANEVEVKVLGGLPITVQFVMYPAEPDVGIMSDYIDDWYVTEIAGRPLRKGEKCDWLYKRLEANGETDALLDKLYASA